MAKYPHETRLLQFRKGLSRELEQAQLRQVRVHDLEQMRRLEADLERTSDPAAARRIGDRMAALGAKYPNDPEFDAALADVQRRAVERPQTASSRAESMPEIEKEQRLTLVQRLGKRTGAVVQRLGELLGLSSLDEATTLFEPAVDPVHFSVTSHSVMPPGTTFVINVWAHLGRQRKEVIRRAQEATESVRILQSKGPVQVRRGAVLLVRLQIEDVIINDPEDTILWNGEVSNATFSATIPKTAAKGQRRGLAKVFVSSLEIAKIHFLVQIGNKKSSPCRLRAHEQIHRTAFASYANEDRDAVLARVQGIHKVAPNLDVFLDVVKLRSGEDWEKRLWKEIPSKDVFYLFWSEGASRSNWVEKEWKCALSTKGPDFIDPVPLASPQTVPPPPELASKHFNDWELAFMSARQVRLN